MRWLRWYIALYVLLLLFLAAYSSPMLFPSLRYTLTAAEQEYLAARGSLRALGDDNFPPFSYVLNGRAAGFERDLVRALEAVLGVPIEHTQGPWVEMRAKLGRGEADFITGMRILPERLAMYRFTKPYHATFHALIVPKDSALQNLSDLPGQRVAAQRSSATYEMMEKQGVSVYPVLMPEEGFKLLENGLVDAWVEQYWVARFLVGFRGLDRWEVRPLGNTSGAYAMAVSLHSDEILVSILNKGLLRLEANGVLEDLYARWFGPTIEVGDAPSFFPILAGAFGLATLVLGLIFMGMYLESQVDSKKRQLMHSNLSLFSEQRKLKKMLLNAARALGATIEIKDFNTGNHSQRVARAAYIIAEQMGFSGKKLFTLYLGALMHDIGKVGIADAILAKDGELSPEEHREIRQHPQIGAGILQRVEGYDEVREVVLYHHERWDGELDHRYPAYPGQRFGEAIPLGARIVAVADAFDAITSDRPYRAARSVPEALEILKACAGGQFDPAVVKAALLSADKLQAVAKKAEDEEITGSIEEQLWL
ncbi:MAG: Cyclic di-GMP phosphodiesterase response regulator RpfG [Firmicutes bacterium]|nr:Cyclic di-GMP phosphodiesterase response regulator RpfG [Bacillota bacterium]